MSEHEVQGAVTEETEAPEAVEVETSQPVKDWADEDESEAKLFGWKAPDQWQGEKPEGYIDNPKEYLDRVQRSRIFQTMQEKMAEQERKLAAMNDKALERQKADYDRQLAQIAQRQRQAVEEADTETFDRLERQKSELAKQAPEAPKPQAPQEVVQFREANAWAKDPVLWNEAIEAVDVGLSQGLVQSDDPAGQLQFAERTILAKYPHLKPQEAPKPKRQMVDSGGLAGGAPSGRAAFDKLPADAKSTFQRFVSKGIYEDTAKDKEEYAREYNNA